MPSRTMHRPGRRKARPRLSAQPVRPGGTTGAEGATAGWMPRAATQRLISRIRFQADFPNEDRGAVVNSMERQKPPAMPERIQGKRGMLRKDGRRQPGRRRNSTEFPGDDGCRHLPGGTRSTSSGKAAPQRRAACRPAVKEESGMIGITGCRRDVQRSKHTMRSMDVPR